MPKKAYIGIGGVARQCKKIYVGVDAIARKVKKAYVGVGGTAKLFFSGGELAFNGRIKPDVTPRHSVSSGNIKNYALFAGGEYSTGTTSYICYKTVDAYDKSLTLSHPEDLRYEVADCSSARAGNYLLFGGGFNKTPSIAYSYGSYVDAYDSSLTKAIANNLPNNAVQGSAIRLGNYALFAGGQTGSITMVSTVSAFDSSLTRSSASSLQCAVTELSCGTVGNYALFAGGRYYSSGNKYSNMVTCYDTSLTKTNATNLSVNRYWYYYGNSPSVSVGNYVLFPGGIRASTSYSTVEAYDSSLTQSVITSLSVTSSAVSGVSIGDYGVLNIMNKKINVYDASLTRTTPFTLSSAPFASVSGTYVGDYALFMSDSSNAASASFLDTFILN